MVYLPLVILLFTCKLFNYTLVQLNNSSSGSALELALWEWKFYIKGDAFSFENY